MEKKLRNKDGKKLERYFKGVSNGNRITILLLLKKESGLSLSDISDNFNLNYKTIAEHVRKLTQAGLVNKKYRGLIVEHSLSPYGERFVKFMKTFLD